MYIERDSAPVVRITTVTLKDFVELMSYVNTYKEIYEFKEISIQAGIKIEDLANIMSGKIPDQECLNKLCKWMDLDIILNCDEKLVFDWNRRYEYNPSKYCNVRIKKSLKDKLNSLKVFNTDERLTNCENFIEKAIENQLHISDVLQQDLNSK